MTITDFLTSTFPAWSPSPELLRAPADNCDELLELMGGTFDLSYREALRVNRCNDSWDYGEDGASGADVLAVGFFLTLTLIAAVTAYLAGA